MRAWVAVEDAAHLWPPSPLGTYRSAGVAKIALNTYYNTTLVWRGDDEDGWITESPPDVITAMLVPITIDTLADPFHVVLWDSGGESDAEVIGLFNTVSEAEQAGQVLQEQISLGESGQYITYHVSSS